MIVLFMISNVLAYPFTTELVSSNEKSNKYSILGIYAPDKIPFIRKGDKLAEYKLLSNTDKCMDTCSAGGVAILYSKQVLFYDFDAKDSSGRLVNVTSKIYIDVNETYLTEVPATYEKKCSTKILGNPTEEYCWEVPTSYKSIIQTRTVQKEYKDEILEAGTYYWTIEGTKDPYTSVDWAVGMNGISTDKVREYWANWTTGDCYGKGGTITIVGDTCIHTFTASGSFNITQVVNASMLIIGGGGGAGNDWGGGGGAGGVINSSSYPLANNVNYNIVIGAGGAGGTSGPGNTGGNTTFANSTLTLIAIGGGRSTIGASATDGNGGSGAGASDCCTIRIGGIAQQPTGGTNGAGTGNGFNGGGTGNSDSGSGGGGGAGGVGTTGSSGAAGPGGIGYTSSINGTSVCYAGGGGGGGKAGGTATCGGGAGTNSSAGANATFYGGGGGGGGPDSGDGGSGYQGAVIIAYNLTVTDCGTGGNITIIGDNCIHTFTANGTFTPPKNVNAKVLVVAGGGGGGQGVEGKMYAGGAGAGGLIYISSYSVTSQSYAVTVGAGGGSNSNGQNSSFNNTLIVAVGGGTGGATVAPTSGGSGGGGCGGGATDCSGAYKVPGNGISGQGYAGGNGGDGTDLRAAGGGGASQVGYNYGNGAGGDGIVNPISGSTIGQNISGVYYLAGGGGGAGGTVGTGGKGGGGNGSSGGVGLIGTANTGGGGGGGSHAGNSAGGAGGSGVVIISYSTTATAPTINIVYPTAINYATSPTALNYTYTNTLAVSCKYSLNGGAINTSMTCGTNITGLSANLGSNTWTAYINDSASTGTSSVTFTLNATLIGKVVTTAGANIVNATVYLFNSTGSLMVNKTSNSSGDWTYSFVNGTIINWTVVGYNTFNTTQGGKAYPFFNA